jgi:hypothetical protein
MTILSESLGLAQLSNHAQFRGAKFSKMIQFGADGYNSSILLEGVVLFSRDMGIEDQEEFMRANGKIQRVSAVKDDVGNLSFWMKDGEVHCQVELLATPEVFDDIYATLCTLKDTSLYNFFVNMNMDKLLQMDNRVKDYTLMFIENSKDSFIGFNPTVTR